MATELIKERGKPVGHVELFKETHANRSGQFISQATADAHVSLWFIVFYFLL